MSIARRKKQRPLRDKAYVAHDALGHAIGQLCVTDHNARLAVISGFTRAVREHVAGGVTADVKGRLEAAGALLAEAHGIQETRRARRRKRR